MWYTLVTCTLLNPYMCISTYHVYADYRNDKECTAKVAQLEQEGVGAACFENRETPKDICREYEVLNCKYSSPVWVRE